MSEQEQDLTPSIRELMTQMAQMQAELDSLKQRAKNLTPLGAAPADNSSNYTPLITNTRRKTLKQLGLALLGGVATATALGAIPVAQARIIVPAAYPIGFIAIPPEAPAPVNLPPGGGTISYGVVASGDTTKLDLASLPGNNIGVYGYSSSGIGVEGASDNYHGVYGGSKSGKGVYGYTADTTGAGYGVYGLAATGGYSTGVYGGSDEGWGVWGSSNFDTGVHGNGPTGVSGIATANSGIAVKGENANTTGISGGFTNNGNFTGSLLNQTKVGVLANVGSDFNVGTLSPDTSYGIYSKAVGNTTNWAGYFIGDVHISGTISKGMGTFKIDHPLDPENKYLYHSFVESPDMLNIYDGIATLDNQGEAIVIMPEWFEALNSDFRYQLTSIRVASPNLHLAEEMQDRKFKIAGGLPGQKVCWMVTGIRQDAYARAHRIPVEEEKNGYEKGKYLHAEEFGQPMEKSLYPYTAQLQPVISLRK